MIFINAEELQRLTREHPGLVVTCAQCQNARRDQDHGYATCTIALSAVAIFPLRVCSAFQERH